MRKIKSITNFNKKFKIKNFYLIFPYFPPNNCIPNNANITINKNNRNKSEIIERIEFINERTKFRRLTQYLQKKIYKILS